MNDLVLENSEANSFRSEDRRLFARRERTGNSGSLVIGGESELKNKRFLTADPLTHHPVRVEFEMSRQSAASSEWGIAHGRQPGAWRATRKG